MITTFVVFMAMRRGMIVGMSMFVNMGVFVLRGMFMIMRVAMIVGMIMVVIMHTRLLSVDKKPAITCYW
ncbi:MAG: hypothetical protein LBT13_07510 [Treponema sp.]|jgi:hypothetical protein|nr:hypothetical protein [Treponema sp.]